MPRERGLLRGAAKLHDFGKVATPARILLKPGPLTAEERRVMELHTVIGYDLLRDSDSPLLDVAAKIALWHHERWDGAGYPQGLAGDEIPIEARIASVDPGVVDAFSAARPEIMRVRSSRKRRNPRPERP